MNSATYKTVQLKNYNRISMLNFIRRSRTVTKAELAAATGLTFMAIKKNMEELLELNLVREGAYKNGSVGRRAVTYAINEKYGYTVGLHINIFRTCAAVMDLNGEVIAQKKLAEGPLPGSQHEYIEQLLRLLEETIAMSKVERSKLLGLGIGAPGPVNSAEGQILTPPNFGLIRFMPLKRIMEERLGLPTILHKDTNAIAFGEYWRGAGKGYENLVYIDADMGIGSSLILGGEVCQGDHFAAGEFGHITLDLNGPRCNCGNIGCLEAMASGIAIQRDVRALLQNDPSHPLYPKRADITLEEILEQAAQSDPLCISALNKAAFYMGNAINTLINIVDPQRIIVGGILAIQYPQYLEIVKSSVFTKPLQNNSNELIVPAYMASQAGVIGAGELVAHHFFSKLIGEVLAKE